jgi:hypothetical protein
MLRIGNTESLAAYKGIYWFYEGVDCSGHTILRDLKDSSFGMSIPPTELIQPRVLTGKELERQLNAVKYFQMTIKKEVFLG